VGNDVKENERRQLEERKPKSWFFNGRGGEKEVGILERSKSSVTRRKLGGVNCVA